MNEKPLIRLERCTFGYGKRVVVENVDLTVKPGQLVGIMGPNGSGKTTLIRGMLGLIAPISGKVERNVRAIGYVPQREALDPLYPLTALEVVFLGAYGRLKGTRRIAPEDRQLAESCLGRVGLADCERSMFADLSGGQRQRVLIARALMVRPDVLLLDEPTSGVDVAAVRDILELLRDLEQERKLAILLVSHQVAVIREAVEEVLWVTDRHVHSGPAREMLGPEALERFLGSMRVHD